MCVFVSRPMNIATFRWKNGDTPKWVVDFLWEKTHSETKIMEIVEDFDEQSYNNNGKPGVERQFSEPSTTKNASSSRAPKKSLSGVCGQLKILQNKGS